MYKVEFPVFRGLSTPFCHYHDAGTFDDLDKAIAVAQKCFGRVMKGKTQIKSFEL
jgi:hypothetical protein